MLNGRGFRVLFGHYESFEENDGDLTYLDVKSMPIGIFGNLLVRIINLYEGEGMTYVDHFELSQHDNDRRIVLLFRKVG